MDRAIVFIEDLLKIACVDSFHGRVDDRTRRDVEHRVGDVALGTETDRPAFCRVTRRQQDVSRLQVAEVYLLHG